MYLWRMINEARVYPLQTIQAQGIDEEMARQTLGEDARILDEGLPPLVWNDSLFQAAAGHNQDMVAQLYYSSTGLNDSTVADRIAAQGYEAVGSDELLGAMAFATFMEPLETAKMVFSNWLLDELTPGKDGPRRIFSRVFTEVGLSFNSAVLELGENIPHNAYIVVADFACPQALRFYLVGNVYQDVDDDGRWDFGEGRPAVGMSSQSMANGAVTVFASGPLGAYQVEIPSFYGTIAVLDDYGQPVLKKIINGAALGRKSSKLYDFPIR